MGCVVRWPPLRMMWDSAAITCDRRVLRVQWQDYRAFRVIRNRGARVGCPASNLSRTPSAERQPDKTQVRCNSCSRQLRYALCELGSWMMLVFSPSRGLASPRLIPTHACKWCHLLALFRAKEGIAPKKPACLATST
jgi:hypothetical protein